VVGVAGDAARERYSAAGVVGEEERRVLPEVLQLRDLKG
jgi:hypothetical protein